MTNRANIVMLFVFRLTQFAITLVVWSYLFKDSTSINGYTWEEMLSYFFTIMMTGMLFYPSHMFELQPMVRKGLLNNYLLKPIHFPAFFFAKFCASKSIVITLCVGLLAFISLQVHLKIDFNFLAIIYLCLNLLMSFTLGICIGCFAFWIVEMWPFRQIYQGCMVLFGGVIAPIEFLPSVLSKIALLTPFYYQGYGTVLMLQGRLSTSEIVHHFLIIGGYTCLFYIAYIWLWNRGLKRYEAVNQ